jgi:hypothetical protein
MKLGKLAALLVLAALVASSLTMVNAASVQDIPKPSVPTEFTVKIVAYPYDVPDKTSASIDQYTGKEIVSITPGYHVENKSIEITIKNQPFTPYEITSVNTDENYTVELFYNVRVKGHYGNDWDWKELYDPRGMHTRDMDVCISPSPKQSNSQYTTLNIPADYPNDALLDIQVQRLCGFFELTCPYTGVGAFAYYFNGKSSYWSNSAILKMGAIGSTAIPDTSTYAPTEQATLQPIQPLPTPTQTDAPITQTEPISQSGAMFFFENTSVITLGVSCVLIGVILVVMAFSRKRRR